ncbi:hypothetical protein R2103_14285 [Nitrosomonas sp. Is24]|uniref:hypothetical protein n=1 Tax=Nitrosomonas sp. Is24 TaxID=3080533 RepID=UPI00294B31DA|nr:hypothetical protein [Nitrosomonas sp. Is24]MDV6342938.1 hypothetical protein [Nitrosomonas sp. Is24]
MAYLYQGKCLDTVQRLHESVAAACPPVSGTYSLQCTPSATQVDILATDIFSAATYTSVLIPSQIPCDVSLLDQTAFFWQLAGVLVVGFSIRAIIKAFQ